MVIKMQLSKNDVLDESAAKQLDSVFTHDARMSLSEYGNDYDLILRKDAVNAIRERCIFSHIPFDSSTPEGERALEAIDAIRKVKAVAKG